MKLIHVGLGGFGINWETEALPHAPEVERVAIVEPMPQQLAKAQKQLKLDDSMCFTSLDEALGRQAADIVLITAPLAAHVPIALQALEAGCHVLTEKPFAESVDQGRLAVAAAQRAGKHLMVSQQYRFYPAARTAARLNREHALGTPGNVHVNFRRWANDTDYDEHPHYKFPHPMLADMAIHHWDLMRMVLDSEGAEVYAKAHSPGWSKFDQESEATAIVTMANGQVVTYRGSWVTSGEPTDWAGEWAHEFSDGLMTWRSRGDARPDGRLTDTVTLHRRGERAERVKLDPQVPLGRSAGLQHLVACITEGVEPETSGRRNLGTLALMDAALRSAETGRVEAVRLD